MGRASTPNHTYKAYKTKAASLLEYMKERDVPDGQNFYGHRLPWDGPWIQLGRRYNVGAKMLVWMVDQGMIERRGETHGMGVVSILYDWYRIATMDAADDLGDLWVE